MLPGLPVFFSGRPLAWSTQTTDALLRSVNPFFASESGASIRCSFRK